MSIEKSLIDEDFIDDEDVVVEVDGDEDLLEDEIEPVVEKPKRAEKAIDDELDAVSDKVKARIEALRKQVEFEQQAKIKIAREAEAAIKTAAEIRRENEQIKGLYSDGEKAFISQTKEAIDSQLKSAKQAYKDAFERGDAEAAAEAQMVIADLTSRKREVDGYRSVEFRAPPELPKIAQAPQVDTRAVEWQSSNQWFGRDEEMSALALATHRRLVQQGIHPVNNAEKYYAEIDATMRRRFPDKFEEEKPAKKKAAPSAVAPVSHQIVSGKRTTKVKLTESQVTLARRLGLTPQQYASQLIKEMNGE